ncbi:LysR family transcriptional regulator [Halomonas sp. QX-2]|uniref:LysR family transcriptional regulator n=1 Tax=Vreelandella sedimenti TaxID=2729618 RepID=A0A7Z0NCX6_9GAMM|nr:MULTISPECIES: LysR family transcriptional regulator [Halomonas]NYT75256.1 LysR family transcriptional regulator [Halomonas sedimenti]|tara:strand:- start:16496 stop:17431 length:936 start_codon:yes stop_codon:yes gene_type:complete
MDLNALRIFERVAATGSFTATARHFHRAVSSVSRQIASLEEALGQQLFYRHTRAVTLTEAGWRYYQEVREILERLDLATEALTAPNTVPSGVLRLNAPVAFGQRQIVPILHHFQRRYPAIKAELMLTDQLTDPVREGIDITFRVGELADSTLVARRLASMNYVVAAAPAYLQRCGRPNTPDDLEHHDCLLYQGEMGRQRWYFNHAEQPQAFAYKVDGSLYSNDAESLVRAALMGQGLVMFPTWLIADELASGTLLPVLEAWRCEVVPGRRDIHVLYAQRRLHTRKVSAFLDHLFEMVGSTPDWDRWRGRQD